MGLGDRACPRRILVITGDHTLSDATKWEGRYTEDDLELHAEMRAALESLPGYEFEFVVEHRRLLEHIGRDRPDFVLNFCDTGFGNVATQELHVPALLELLGIPYSGAPPAGMVLCYDKAVVKLLAQDLGVPTPREIYLEAGRAPSESEAFYPALIKPAEGDGSVGIAPESVVRTPEHGERYLARLRDERPGEAVLWQEYLPGPEYGLALIGNTASALRALPPLEVDYSGLPSHTTPILPFAAKTGPDTSYTAVEVRPARLPEGLLQALRGRAEILFARLRCRDYARFDFRTGADGQVKLLEVNPNPAWSYAGKLALMAGFAGLTYAELLRMIIETGEARTALPPRAPPVQAIRHGEILQPSRSSSHVAQSEFPGAGPAVLRPRGGFDVTRSSPARSDQASEQRLSPRVSGQAR